MAPRERKDVTVEQDGAAEADSEVKEAVVKSNSSQPPPPWRIVWRNVVTMTILHSASLHALFLIPRSNPLTILWSMFCFVFSALGITAGVHRLWSHRSYKASLTLRILLATANSMAFQNDIFEWSRDHRVHHKYSETDADPHDARRGFFFSHMGWLLLRKRPEVIAAGKRLDLSDLYNDPVVMWQRRFYKKTVVLMCFVIPTVVPWALWGESLWNAYFLAAVLRYILLLNCTWLVNSAAHMYGMRPYDRTINPRENRFVVFAAIGEGYHNYHHTFPYDYAASEFGWKVNLTTAFIDLACWIGLAGERHSVSTSVIEARKKRTGECSN
uniref:stearoyl-CoA desaturase 5-like n=1 Tax=Myxine glutinosa TaxID=7769 RepID=UPI00358F032E